MKSDINWLTSKYFSGTVGRIQLNGQWARMKTVQHLNKQKYKQGKKICNWIHNIPGSIRIYVFVMTVKDSHLHQFTNMTLVYIFQVLEVLSSGLCRDNVLKIVHEGQEYQKQNISTSYKQFWIFFCCN